MMVPWAALGVAIVAEVCGTALLPKANGLRHPGWAVLVLGLYGIAVWGLTVAVRDIPVSVAYAVWAGAGTALVAAAGFLVLHERFDPVKAFGVAAIIVGVVAINLHSSAA